MEKQKIYRVMVKIGNIDNPLDDPLDAEYTGLWHSLKTEAEIELMKARKEYKIAWIEERELNYKGDEEE